MKWQVIPSKWTKADSAASWPPEGAAALQVACRGDLGCGPCTPAWTWPKLMLSDKATGV